MKTQVLIIGGGATGTGLLRDLSLRGVKCLLVEQQDINAGASGGNHGLLHSGARYVSKDGEAAVECMEEGKILKTVAPACIEETGGLFVAVKGDDEEYVRNFPDMCDKYHIPCQEISLSDARKMEPVLSGELTAAFVVNDATIDPFMLSLENISHARMLGSKVLRYNKVIGFNVLGDVIDSTRLFNAKTGEETLVEADIVVNAGGGWASEIAAMAGAGIPMMYSKGSLLVTQNRLTRRVINRLRQASDADILVPGGTVSILGTTSITIATPDEARPTVEEVDNIIREGAAMIPMLATARYIRAFSGVRPLVSACGGDGRSVSRGYTLIDHDKDRITNFVSITGGKLTTYRLMAERTADLVCSKLKIDTPCTTRTEPLPETHDGKWAEPASAPKFWVKNNTADDTLLCECEMVSKQVVEHIVTAIKEQKAEPTIKDVGLRSRIGKGPCQGAFCSLRIAAHMYDINERSGDEGIDDIKEFINSRWRGQRPLLAGVQLAQAELQEALQCGLYNLDKAQSE